MSQPTCVKAYDMLAQYVEVSHNTLDTYMASALKEMSHDEWELKNGTVWVTRKGLSVLVTVVLMAEHLAMFGDYDNTTQQVHYFKSEALLLVAKVWPNG